MTRTSAPPGAREEALLRLARAGDEAAFAELAERFRAELQLHCYRIVGSAAITGFPDTAVFRPFGLPRTLPE